MCIDLLCSDCPPRVSLSYSLPFAIIFVSTTPCQIFDVASPIAHAQFHALSPDATAPSPRRQAAKGISVKLPCSLQSQPPPEEGPPKPHSPHSRPGPPTPTGAVSVENTEDELENASESASRQESPARDPADPPLRVFTHPYLDGTYIKLYT